MAEAPLRVLIVDDHDVVRAGLKALIDAEADLAIVGEAADGAEALRRTGQLEPDVLLLDLRLPDQSGTDVCRAVGARWPNVRVLIITSYADENALIDTFHAGASGYVLKRLDTDALLEAIRTVGAGEKVFGSELDRVLASRLRNRDPVTDLEMLSAQERVVLDHLAEGLTNKQIAERMFLSDKTVKNYVSHILTKLGMSSRTEAAAFAVAARNEQSRTFPPEEWSSD